MHNEEKQILSLKYFLSIGVKETS